MAMVKVRASCVGGMFRSMKSQLHTKTIPEYLPYWVKDDLNENVKTVKVPKLHVKEPGSEPVPEEIVLFEEIYSRDPNRTLRVPPPSWNDRYKYVRDNIPPNYWFGRGRDYAHWRIYLKPLRGPRLTKDDFVSYYLRTIAQLHFSEASRHIYSMATKHYFAFGANMFPEDADYIKGLPNVVLVTPDYYEDPKEERYPWDAYVNGEVLSYDPKHYPSPATSESLCDEELEITGREVPTREYAD